MISLRAATGTLLAVTVGGMFASVTPPFSDLISISANNISPYPGPDIHFDYFVGALLGLLCGGLLMAGPIDPRTRSTAIFCWAVKLAAALVLVPVYEYAYGLDIDGYYWFDAKPEFDGIDIGRSRTWNIRLLAWAVLQVIGPSFHGGKVVFSFVGFLGIYLAYRGSVAFMKSERPSLLALMSLAPTSLFWATSLGKDPLVLFGVGVYCYGSLHWLQGFRFRYLAFIFAGGALASYIRPYFLPIMGLPLALPLLFQSRRPLVRLLSLPLVVGGAAYSVRIFSSTMNIETFDSFMSYQAGVAAAWQGGSSFTLPVIDTPIKLVLVAPLVVFTALFRPTIFEAHNLFALGAALDNTVLLVIFCYALSRSRLRELLEPEPLWMTGFILMWAVMYGIGTGNLGAISRFKIQVLPVLIVLLVFMARKRAPAAP